MTGLALSITPPPGPGWVQLPVEQPRRGGLGKIFGAGSGKDKALTDWATARAREALGPDAAPAAIAAHTETLTRLTLGCRERGEKLAFAWFPEPGAAPAAQISVSRFGHSGEQPTLDLLEEKFAWRDGQTGPLEVDRTDLPGGPAVRVRREQATGDDPSDVVVSVTYAFVPPRTTNAIIFTMYWALSDDDSVFTEIADTTAKTLRAVPAP